MSVYHVAHSSVPSIDGDSLLCSVVDCRAGPSQSSGVLGEVIDGFNRALADTLDGEGSDPASDNVWDDSSAFHDQQNAHDQPTPAEAHSAEIISAAIKRLSLGPPHSLPPAPPVPLQRRRALRLSAGPASALERRDHHVVSQLTLGGEADKPSRVGRSAKTFRERARRSSASSTTNHPLRDALGTPRKASISSASSATTIATPHSSWSQSTSSSCSSFASTSARNSAEDSICDHHPLPSPRTGTVHRDPSRGSKGYAESDFVPLYQSKQVDIDPTLHNSGTPSVVAPPVKSPPPSAWPRAAPSSVIPRARQIHKRLSDQFLSLRQGRIQHRRVASASDAAADAALGGLKCRTSGEWTAVEWSGGPANGSLMGGKECGKRAVDLEQSRTPPDVQMRCAVQKRRTGRHRREAIRLALEQDDAVWN